MNGVQRFPGLVALLAGEVVLVGLLHRVGGWPWLRVGWHDPSRWLASAPPEDAIMAALRVVALVGAYWLLITTVCYVAARAARIPAAVRAVEWATLPAVRRVADGAVTAALIGCSVTLGGLPVAVAAPEAQAAAGAAAAPASTVEGMLLPPAVTGPSTVPASLEPATTPDREGPAPPPPDRPGGSPPADLPGSAGDLPASPLDGAAEAATHVVAAGDNLWAIAAADLGGSASLAQIHSRWRTIIEANRDRLRSGDPDLVYPGERIVLPPPRPPAG